jgi:hypothetical protein
MKTRAIRSFAPRLSPDRQRASLRQPDDEREQEEERTDECDDRPSIELPEDAGEGRADRAADEVASDECSVEAAPRRRVDCEEPCLIQDVDGLDLQVFQAL